MPSQGSRVAIVALALAGMLHLVDGIYAGEKNKADAAVAASNSTTDADAQGVNPTRMWKTLMIALAVAGTTEARTGRAFGGGQPVFNANMLEEFHNQISGYPHSPKYKAKEAGKIKQAFTNNKGAFTNPASASTSASTSNNPGLQKFSEIFDEFPSPDFDKEMVKNIISSGASTEDIAEAANQLAPEGVNLNSVLTDMRHAKGAGSRTKTGGKTGQDPKSNKGRVTKKKNGKKIHAVGEPISAFNNEDGAKTFKTLPDGTKVEVVPYRGQGFM